MSGELIEGYFGQPALVMVEMGAQAFSTLDKAMEFIEAHGLSTELISVSETYFTPLGTIYREVVFEEESEE